ncbi:hypothetical protein [Prochlorothrix hollandica]|uniref:hypothetical protein n=1 Tax=Prochlorothrix hollandica TaxID=1223 RepID=UPI003340C44C
MIAEPTIAADPNAANNAEEYCTALQDSITAPHDSAALRMICELTERLSSLSPLAPLEVAQGFPNPCGTTPLG